MSKPTRVIVVRPFVALAALLAAVAAAHAHMPATYVGKVMCNGIMAEKAHKALDGTVTIWATNGAVITIHDGGQCATLDHAPAGGMLDDERQE